MKKSIKKLLKKQGYIIYNFKGTSMLPLLVMDEDKVYIKKEEKYDIFDIVLFQTSKRHFVLHRIVGKKDGKFAVIGDNSSHVDFIEERNILGKIVGYYKKDTYFDLSSTHYVEYMKNYVFKRKEIREKLIDNSIEFFKQRIENAFYQLIKLMFNKTIDKNAFTILAPFEKKNFYVFALSRKAAHLVGLLVEKYSIDFGNEINKHALDQLNKAKMRYVVCENAINQLSNELNKAKIPHIFLKGSELRKRYFLPFLRVSNDIDLVVNSKDFDKAKEILIKIFEGKFLATTPHDESFECKKLKMDVELHHSINTDLSYDLAYLLENPFEGATQDQNYPYRFHLAKEKECIFHLSHFAKHINGGDYWITMFSDTFLLKKEFEDNFEKIKVARLDKFYNILNELFGKIFSSKNISKECADFESFIFRTNKEIQMSLQKGKYKNKFNYILMRIFPPYRYFYGGSKALQKVPLLLPFFWIKRWFVIIFVKGHLIKKTKTEIKSFNEESIDDIQILNNAGLNDYLIRLERNTKRF